MAYEVKADGIKSVYIATTDLNDASTIFLSLHPLAQGVTVTAADDLQTVGSEDGDDISATEEVDPTSIPPFNAPTVVDDDVTEETNA